MFRIVGAYYCKPWQAGSKNVEYVIIAEIFRNNRWYQSKSMFHKNLKIYIAPLYCFAIQ